MGAVYVCFSLTDSRESTLPIAEVQTSSSNRLQFCLTALRKALHKTENQPKLDNGLTTAGYTAGLVSLDLKERKKDMTSATLTSKGQVTIPSKVRLALGVKAGDRVEFVQVLPGRLELVAATHSVTELKGIIRKPKSPVSIEDMNAAIVARGPRSRR